MAAMPSIPGLSLPGIPSLPLDLSSSATSRLDTSGSIYHASGDGDWNVTLGGSAPSIQATGTGPLIVLAVILGAMWLLRKA